MSQRAVITYSVSILIAVSFLFVACFTLRTPNQKAIADNAPTAQERMQQATENSRTLSENLSQVQEQQRIEREVVMAELVMPDGYSYSGGETFDSLSAQSDALEARLSDRSAGTTDSPAPELVKYEDGFFTASAASDWQCAWLMEAIKHSKEKNFQKVDSDIATLESFRKYTYIQYFPDYDMFLQDAVYPLTKGNTAVAQSFINTSCSISQPE